MAAFVISGGKWGGRNYRDRYSRCSEVVIAFHCGHYFVQCIAFVKIEILDGGFEYFPDFLRRASSGGDIHAHMTETRQIVQQNSSKLTVGIYFQRRWRVINATSEKTLSPVYDHEVEAQLKTQKVLYSRPGYLGPNPAGSLGTCNRVALKQDY